MSKGFEIVEGRMGGVPCVIGHRISVSQVLASLAEGMTIQEFCEDMDQDLEEVTAAVKGAAQFFGDSRNFNPE